MASLRPFEDLVAEVAASIDATRLHNLKKAVPAALRLSAYLVRYKPGFLDRLVDEEAFDIEDFITLLHYNGISSERYEG